MDGEDRPATPRHRPARVWVRLLRLPRRRLYAVGGGAAAVLAGTLALAVSLGAGAAPACAALPAAAMPAAAVPAAAVPAVVVPAAAVPAAAAPPAAGTEHSGQATHYALSSGGGNCSYPGPPADGLYAALSPTEYDAAAACGGYLDVTGPNGTVRVKIIDQCPECGAGHLDLSRDAFARIADLSAGIVPVSYRMVADPPPPGPLAFRVKEGASQFWFAVLVIDHGNPLATVEARAGGGGWQPLDRQDYNYWLAENGLGPGPYELRVTDVAGHRATVPGIALAPEQLQTTDVSMYGAVSAPVVPAPPPSPSPAGPAPSPVPSAEPGRTPSPAAAVGVLGTRSPHPPSCR